MAPECSRVLSRCAAPSDGTSSHHNSTPISKLLGLMEKCNAAASFSSCSLLGRKNAPAEARSASDCQFQQVSALLATGTPASLQSSWTGAPLKRTRATSRDRGTCSDGSSRSRRAWATATSPVKFQRAARSWDSSPSAPLMPPRNHCQVRSPPDRCQLRARTCCFPPLRWCPCLAPAT